MKIKALLLTTALGLLMATGAIATTINFDGISTNPTAVQIPNGYGGLQWDQYFYALDANTLGGGYLNGMVSQNNVAFNRFSHQAKISSLGIAFDLNSAYLAAAWNDGLNLKIDGLLAGIAKYSKTVLVDATGPSFVQFDWTGIDNLVFTSSGGTDHGYGGHGAMFVMDNLTINEPVRAVPEPATLLGFGLPMLMVGLGKLRGLRK